MCPIFLSHGRRLVLTNPNATDTADKEIDISDKFLSLTNKFINYSSMSFSDPQYVEISCTDELAKSYYKY